MDNLYAIKRWSGHVLPRLFTLLLGCSMWLGGASSTQAYEVSKDNRGRVIKWKSPVIRWYLNVGSFRAIPQATVQAVFVKAFQKWANIQCSSVTFIFSGKTGSYTNNKDGKNVISFPPNFTSKHGSNLFVSGSRLDQNAKFTDMDIEINPTVAWSTKGGGQDLEAVAMVLAGRLMGLGNSKVKGATMEGNAFLSGDISRRSLHPDDIQGAIALYPGSCGKKECNRTADCSSVDIECKSNKCVLLQSAKPRASLCKPCKSKSDCGGSDMACDLINNTTYCLQPCSPDGLCPPNYSCSGGGVNAQCLPSSGLCSASSCQSNADCSAGFLCKSGKCQPECQTDSDCPAKKPQCQSGRCSAKGACTRDLDCSVGLVCKSGQCVPSGTPCSSNQDCTKAGEKCINGYCKLATPCKSDNDCPAGQACQKGYCLPSGGSTNCQDGKTQPCSCAGGKQGSQTCTGGKWGTCQCGGSTNCQDGKTQPCSCAGGKQGSQTCTGGQWGTCQCGGAGKTCTPGATQACTCSDGKSGAQVCASDGSRWEACQCSGGCTNGQTQSCACPNGKQGSQTCNNKLWGSCQCGAPGQNCVPGSTQQCFCPNGQGAQSCAADGSRWEACQCGGGGPATDAPALQDGGSGPSKCESHGQCPGNQICSRGVCSSQQPQSGCGCEGIPPQQGGLSLLLLALVFLLRKRVNQHGC